MTNRGFVLVDTPIFTPNACEGTTTLFQTQYFDETAYLTQSGQLYSEATAAAFGKVYCFGPTFRAEKSKTRRHLMEFWMVEPEVAFAQLADMMDLAEEFLAAIVQRVLETRRTELTTLERDISKLERVVPPFPRLTYEEAVGILRKKNNPRRWVMISGATKKPYCRRNSIDGDHPSLSGRTQSFYMQPDDHRPDLALCMDVFAPEGYGEIIGGGQRIHTLELLRTRTRASACGRTSNGTWICASSVPCRMRASGWASNAR